MKEHIDNEHGAIVTNYKTHHKKEDEVVGHGCEKNKICKKKLFTFCHNLFFLFFFGSKFLQKEFGKIVKSCHQEKSPIQAHIVSQEIH
jgi:hypothetical protein